MRMEASQLKDLNICIVLGTSLFILFTSWGVPEPSPRTFTTFCVYEFLSKKLRKLGNFFTAPLYRSWKVPSGSATCVADPGFFLSQIQILIYPRSRIPNPKKEDGKIPFCSHKFLQNCKLFNLFLFYKLPVSDAYPPWLETGAACLTTDQKNEDTTCHQEVA